MEVKMVVKSGFDKFVEQRDAKKTLYTIETKINDLSNLVTNNTVFDARFESAVVQFHMFLERLKDNSLKSLVKDLHGLNFHDYVNQDAYVNHLKRIYDEYVQNDKPDKFKMASLKSGKILNPKLSQFFEGKKQKE